ncbi:MAG: helix-turn-helix domain-containing protein [Alphaproteobacteria bacterium]
MRLRGYDEYEVTLGDEMRGERASLGKTLLDAEYDLRIKADVIRAIEDCDLDGFPNDSVVAGYVRSYARYLGLDREDCYRRFCLESGFRSPVSALAGFEGPAQSGGGMHNIIVAGAALGSGLTQSRFAVKSAPARLSARISLGGLTSALAMLGLIAGLGYGGYALLQDIQRVGFAPLPEAPEVVAKAPLISPPALEGGLLRRPDANAYQGDGVLAAIAPAELPPPALPARDGPISAIDPATSGLFRDRDHDPAYSNGPAMAEEELSAEDEAIFAAVADAKPVKAETMVAAVAPAGPPKVIIHATDAAWIRVRDGDAAVIFEGTLAAGERFEIPARFTEPVLRAGNAGALYVLVDGAPYGPVGSSDRVVKNLSLRAADIERRIPQASAAAIGIVPGDDSQQRAEAVLPQ